MISMVGMVMAVVAGRVELLGRIVVVILQRRGRITVFCKHVDEGHLGNNTAEIDNDCCKNGYAGIAP